MHLFSRKIISLLTLLIIITLSQIIYAEDIGGTIKGHIVSTEGETLYGAHISIPSLNRGTISNTKGEFVIKNLPKGKHRVVISFIGYESEIKVVDLENEQTIYLAVQLKPTPIKTEDVVVTGNPYAVDPMTSPQDVSSLSGLEKFRSEATTIGKTLENIPGIYNLSTGSVAGKPIIRGHTSERVLILSDGIAQEYQQYGERHTPTLDVFNYDRIEVIKGAASLLYGSDAMGGAVNLIPHPYHFSYKREIDINGSVVGGYFSNNNEFMTGIKLNGSTKLFSLNGNLVRRKADNFKTPSVAPYSQTLKRGDPKFTGTIPHTNFEQLNGSFGVGYLSPIGIISVDYDHFLNKNNFLLPEGIPIGLQLQNQIINLKGNFPVNNFIVKPKFSYQRNHRQATRPGLNYTFIPDSAAVDLITDVYTARVEVENVDIFNLSGTFGAEVKHYDHENVGKVPLQPTGKFTNYALFIFEEWRKNRLTLNFGVRFDYRDQLFYRAKNNNPLLQQDDKRNYSSLSGSFGMAYKLFEQLTLTGNISRGFRTPSFFNLYVYGYHGGVFAFQIGNPDLKNEKSLDFSASLRFRNDIINSTLTVFHNLIDDYIFLYNAPNHPLAPTPKPQFIFAHDQADAKMTGVEFFSEAAIFNWLIVSGSYSSIKSKFTSGMWTGGELPLMPPDRITIGTKLLLPDLAFIKLPYVSVNAKFVSAKKAAGIYEPFGQFDDNIGPDIPFGVCSTPKYNVVDASLGFNIQLYSQPINFDLSITNLTNKVYRDFLDTYKGYALAPGRSINLKINMPFVF